MPTARLALRGIAAAMLVLVAAAGRAHQAALDEDQLRSARIEIPRLVELLDLAPGMVIADVGAGLGAWTMAFAKWTGAAGHVFATEIGEPQLAALQDLVLREQLPNVTVIRGGPGTTNLPAACCDAILVRDAYHHFTEPRAMVKSIAAALKPGGRLAIVDFAPRPKTAVPPGVPANRRGHGVPPEVVRREAGAVLTFVRTIPNWSPESEPASLFLAIFRKPSGP